MKCLACNQNAGVQSWWLNPKDHTELNLKERFYLGSCFCSGCYQDHPGDRLEEYLKTYYLLSQPLSEIMQTKSHYYKWHPKAECVEISQEFCSNLGQAMQYLWRSETLNPNAVTKGQTIEDIIKDLEKAQNFIDYEIDRLKGKIQK